MGDRDGQPRDTGVGVSTGEGPTTGGPASSTFNVQDNMEGDSFRPIFVQKDDKVDYRITTLGEENYIQWKWHMTMILETKGLYGYVTGELNNPISDRAAATLLASSLSLLNQSRVINCRTAKSIWDTLEATFENKSSLEKATLLNKFTSFKIKSIKELSKNIGEFQALVAKLRTLGVQVDDDLVISVLIKSLPASFDGWKSIWQQVNAEKPQLNTLITGILAQASQMKQPEDVAMIAHEEQSGPSKAYYTNQNRGRRSNSRYAGRNPRKPRITNNNCFICNKPGHWKQNCPERQKQEKDSGMIAMMVSFSEFCYDTWIIDSGASHSLVGSLEGIQGYVELYDQIPVYACNQPAMKAIGKGYVGLNDLPLIEVYYVPELQINLLSVNSLTQNNMKVIFDRESANIVLNEEVVAQGYGRDGTYWIKIKHCEQARCFESMEGVDTTDDEIETIDTWNVDGAKQDRKEAEICILFDDLAMMTGTRIIDTGDIWIADSGCSHHMTSRKEWLNNYSQFNDPKPIGLSDHSSILAIGSGNVTTTFGGLQSVYYVPKLSANLFSISVATGKGFDVYYTKDKISFLYRNREVLSGKRDGGIYVLEFGVIQPLERACFAVCMDEWHQRFGHISRDTIQRMIRNKAVEGLEIGKDSRITGLCVECNLNKCTRASHGTRSTPRAGKPGASLHFDTAGPYGEESLGGARYFVLCKDEASSYLMLATIDVKNNAADEVKKMISRAELETGNKVLKICTDNGSEFSKLKDFLNDKGINWTRSVAYTPQQNGLVEREIRTVREAAQTMLNKSGLPTSLWAESLACAIYVLNRSSNNPKTPYQQWFGRKPCVKNLRVFGQHAILKYHSKDISKWERKGTIVRFVGYTDRYNTYRVYDTDSNTVITSCDLTFNEEQINETSQKGHHETLTCHCGIARHKEEGNLHEYSDETSLESRERSPPETIQGKSVEIPDLSWDHRGDYEQEGESDLCAEEHGPSLVYDGETSSDDDYDPHQPLSLPQQGTHQMKDKTTDSDESGRRQLPKKLSRAEKIRRLSERLAPSDIHPGHIISSRLRQKKDHAKLAITSEITEPSSYEEATTRPDAHKWKAAMKDEIDSLKKNNVYELVNRPSGNIVTNKWVFKLKRNPNGQIERYKARLVARGFSQKQGIDYFETYAPVVNMVSVRMLFSLAACRQMKMAQFDIKTAFLYGDLDETVYMEQPKGFEEDGDKVCLLKRSLYGLKQSPRQWNKKFTDFLSEMGLQASENDSSVYYKQTPLTIITIYVDDGMIFSEEESEINKILNQLNSRFDMHRLPAESFLGFQIERNSEGDIILHQTRYIKEILMKFNMNDCKPVDTPISITKIELNEKPLRPEVPYREALGSLLYAATITRPDIAYAVGRVGRNQENPTESDWIAMKRVFRYLKGKEHYALRYRLGSKPDLLAYCDADYAEDQKTSRSTSGYVLLFGDSPIQWKSKKQTLITMSPTEAEYVSMSKAIQYVICARLLGQELGIIGSKPTTILTDNESAIRIAESEKNQHRTRHMGVYARYPREKIQEGEVVVKHVAGTEQLADMLTKALTGIKFHTNLKKLLYTIVILAQIMIASANAIKSTVLRTTDHELEVHYIQPCNMIKLTNPHKLGGTKDEEYGARNALASLCDKIYDENWLKQVDKLTNQCKTMRKNKITLPESPKIDKLVGTTATTFLKRTFSPTVVERNEIVELALSKTNVDMIYTLHSDDYLLISSQTAKLHMADIDQVSLRMPKVLWIASHIISSILAQTALLMTITKNCDFSEMATKELAELTGNEDYGRLTPGECSRVTINKGKDQSIIINFRSNVQIDSEMANTYGAILPANGIYPGVGNNSIKQKQTIIINNEPQEPQECNYTVVTLSVVLPILIIFGASGYYIYYKAKLYCNNSPVTTEEMIEERKDTELPTRSRSERELETILEHSQARKGHIRKSSSSVSRSSR